VLVSALEFCQGHRGGRGNLEVVTMTARTLLQVTPLTFAAMLSFDCVKLTNCDIEVRCPGVYDGAIFGEADKARLTVAAPDKRGKWKGL
jgi:hypothetical protein